jgi:hypothetical protein
VVSAPSGKEQVTMRHKGPRFPIRASTAEEKRKRGAFIADIERQTGFPLTASEIARAVRLRAGVGSGVRSLAAAIRGTRAARGQLLRQRG